MADEQNPTAATATEATTATAPEPATLAQLHEVQAQVVDVQAQLVQLHDLVVEHATAMGELHGETGKLVEAVSKDVVDVRTTLCAQLDAMGARLSQFESRLNDAMVRIGVDKAPAPSTAPAAPAIAGSGDMVFDGMNWVAKPAAAATPPDEPTS